MLLNNSTTSLSSPSEILERISSKSFISASSDLSNTQIEELLEITKLILFEICAVGLERLIFPSSLNSGIILFILWLTGIYMNIVPYFIKWKKNKL